MQKKDCDLNGFLRVYSISVTAEIDVVRFMLDAKPNLHDLLYGNVLERPVKIQNFSKLNLEKTAIKDETKIFNIPTMKPVYRERLSDETSYELSDTILSTLSSFTASGIRWILKQIQEMVVKFAVFNPIGVSSNLQLPAERPNLH